MSAAADSGQPAPAPPKRERERAQRQRQRILDAAERCFIESGFHAASMAHIAATAGLSAGLIYRYFENKSAIVRAIIERHLENDGCRLVDGRGSDESLCDRLLDVFECWRRGTNPKLNAALMLELTAECTRDPELGRFIRTHDRQIGKNLTVRVQREARARGVQLSAAAAQARAVILQCLIEGLASRAVLDPALQRRALRPGLERVIAALLS